MIKIIGIGKVKDSSAKEKISDYLSRLKKYYRVEYLEMNKLPEVEHYFIALDEKGKEFTSQEFSAFIERTILSEKKITFVLGPAEGFPRDYLNQFQQKISLSKMTLPHEMARVMFLEQLYRAFTIIKNEPYHK